MGVQRPTQFTAASLVNKVLLHQSSISFIASLRGHHEQITNQPHTYKTDNMKDSADRGTDIWLASKGIYSTSFTEPEFSVMDFKYMMLVRFEPYYSDTHTHNLHM